MADNSFNNTVESLFKGMDSFITTKTVVGDAIHIGDTIILPLVDVSFGVAAGAFSAEKKNNGAGGMGGKIQQDFILYRFYHSRPRSRRMSSHRAHLLFIWELGIL